MYKFKKPSKFLAMLLIIAMCFSLFPSTPALATETGVTLQYTGEYASGANIVFRQLSDTDGSATTTTGASLEIEYGLMTVLSLKYIPLIPLIKL
jgi:hypothetical protein